MSVKNILLERRHMILAARLAQIKLNHLAIKGGRPYINAQLWRAPNEPDISWEGTSIAEPNVPGLKGRKDRACIVNDAGRVAGKINQYLFKESALRDGIDVSFAANVDGQRSSIGAFFERVSDEITSYGGGAGFRWTGQRLRLMRRRARRVTGRYWRSCWTVILFAGSCGQLRALWTGAWMRAAILYGC